MICIPGGRVRVLEKQHALRMQSNGQICFAPANKRNSYSSFMRCNEKKLQANEITEEFTE